MEIAENAGENHDWLCQNAFKGLQNAGKALIIPPLSDPVNLLWQPKNLLILKNTLSDIALFIQVYWSVGQSSTTFIEVNPYRKFFLSGFYHNTICIAFVFVIRLFVCICAATTSSPNVYAPVCLLPTSICLHQHRRQRSGVYYLLGSTFSFVSVI